MNDLDRSIDPQTQTRTDSLDLEMWLEAFAEIAPLKEPRGLLEYLPEGDPAKRRLVLVELIKLDMSEHAATGPVPRIEQYLQAMPEVLAAEMVPLDLVLEEFQLRRETGETPHRSEYSERFPQLNDALERLPLQEETLAPLDRNAASPELQPGEQIDDFTVLRALGSGAFAQVYLARQESMQRLVALKVSQRSGDEPRALAQLQHPNIVRVYDQRRVLEPQAHLLYMQYVAGGTLADVLKGAAKRLPEHRDGSLITVSVEENLLRAAQTSPEASQVRAWLSTASWPSTVAWVGIQLARALDYADRHRILHRDVKPANVLMSAEGIPKLADFNVSATGLSGRAGAAAFFGGSLGYMSPEQLQAADAADPLQASDLDRRSDIYSLGVLLWEMWQTHRPWTSEQTPSSWSEAIGAQRALRDRAPDECEIGGDPASRVLHRVLLQTLQVDRDRRPHDGGELAGRLRLALFPAAAQRFDPPPWSLPGVLRRLPPWLVASVVILVPNILAGVFNYFYNNWVIVSKYPEMQDYFENLATGVNAVAFPAAVVMLVWFMRPLVRGLRKARSAKAVDESELHATWTFGFQAATIGAACWAVAGLVYPIALKSAYPQFTTDDCIHFFISLVMCGLVAWVYPFFGLTTIAVMVYYPEQMQPTMKDERYECRAARIDRRCSRFLIAAAGIPLLGATLVLSGNQKNETWITLVAVIATALGLAAAFSAYQSIRTALDELGTVLSPERPSPVPMPEEEL
ncbi:serine/threonine-protein kinase [Roseimaritima sediminicola]|uniref:serine/threonine-protein kinase n=1 Tax=Roseimaritima sediminicola TaxID=2662066 RepID=UPI001298335D|nr:serine/threonine-protein kinase [Roseimaritima sediminicola]